MHFIISIAYMDPSNAMISQFWLATYLVLRIEEPYGNPCYFVSMADIDHSHLDPTMCNIAAQHNRTSAAGLESQRRCRIALQCTQTHSSHDYLLFLR